MTSGGGQRCDLHLCNGVQHPAGWRQCGVQQHLLDRRVINSATRRCTLGPVSDRARAAHLRGDAAGEQAFPQEL